MAKLSSYYSLCPLIDQQNLLGVEKDTEPGCAIVTLGRNIVIRYKLQDIKQVSSWSTKERLSTQVIYDKQQNCYTAIFNEKYIRSWSENESDLDKVKKYKFLNPLHTILSLDSGSPVLVRQDGATASLEWALKNRKKWSSNRILLKNEKLSDCKLVTVNNKTYLCALAEMGSTHNYIVVGLEKETFLNIPGEMKRIELKKAEKLIGHVVLEDQNNAYLLTLWSNGKLYSYPLTGSCSNPVPGMIISTITSISTNHPVVMVSLNDAIIAAYGADVNEEGAVLLIYDVQFKLIQAIQKLKLYTKDAKLWRVDDKLLLAANRHLAVAPFRLASQRIEAVLGSSLRFKNNLGTKDIDDEVMEIRETTVVQWSNSTPSSLNKTSMKGIPSKIAKQVNNYLNEGMCDAIILQTIIPQLIEFKDISAILWCLDNFHDLSDKLLIDLLSFSLKTSEKNSVPVQNGTSEKNPTHSPHIARDQLLDRILSYSFADVSVVSQLRSTLDFNEILRLINYLINKLSAEDYTESTTIELDEKQLYEWASLFIDSHYQYYLLSQDPQVLEVLNKLNDILNDHFQWLIDIENLRPMLERIARGKSLKPAYTEYSKFYSIEEVQLY